MDWQKTREQKKKKKKKKNNNNNKSLPPAPSARRFQVSSVSPRRYVDIKK